MTEDQSPIRAELDRVGASFRKAGAADYISLSHDSDGTVRPLGRPGNTRAAAGSARSRRRSNYSPIYPTTRG